MKIREIIKAKGLTSKSVAESAGIAEPLLSNILTGKRNPSVPTLRKIAEALHVSVSELMGDTVQDSKMVAFMHFNGQPHTPTTMEEIMCILKEWDEDSFHVLCHLHDFQHMRTKYAHNQAVIRMMDELTQIFTTKP